ncbi:MAG: hypothetical protein M3245_01830 [Actinomycetota bacterium]|nr:hypothetical protein [Actinomycetota bacterium]
MTGSAQESNCPAPQDFQPPPLSFAAPKYIDESRAGGEPVSVVAHDGSISVSAHAGTTHIYKNPNAAPGAGDFAVGYFNQTLNWRSDDGGETWDYVGTMGAPAGPHSLTSTGFSDPDFAIDQAGTIYNVEIDLVNDAVFASNDDGQSYALATPMAAPGDRPWLVALEPNEVFLYVNSLPKGLYKSTTGGLTWTTISTSPPFNGDPVPDPRNPDDGFIGPIGTDGIAITADDGGSFQTYDGANLGSNTGFSGIGAVGVDRAGHAYLGAAGGFGNSGEVTYNYFDRDALRWGKPVRIPAPQGEALWPWIVAGDDGRVAMTWYQTHPGKPDEYYAYVAYTLNGRGTTATCSDGSTVFIPPQFSVANASGRVIHKGQICLQGTTCNLDLGEGGDRRLGDFFTINFTHKGELFIASGDTMLRNPVGGPKPVANPIFIKQNGGAMLLEEPDVVRPTRCILNLPTC